MNIIETPEIFGSTIFCDDVRMEVDNKITYVGVYSGDMLVKAPSFPVVLPKFCMVITFWQKREIYKPNLSLRIFLPGDPEETASIQGELESPTNPPDESSPFVVSIANAVFTPLLINEPGAIKVRVIRGDGIHKLGQLRVIQSHVEATTSSNVSPPPS